MNIALIGLQKSGKTTIFNALTGQDAEVTGYVSSRVEPNRGIVDIHDPRVTELARIYEPRKTVYATVEFVDFAGLSKGAGEHGVFSGEALQLIKTSDALAVVVRNFHDTQVDQVHGLSNPAGELEEVLTELLLADQIAVERRLERIQGDLKRGKKTPQLTAEQQLFSEMAEQLNEGTPVREMGLTAEQQKLLAGYQFLTSKPVFTIVNSDEAQYGKSGSLIEKLSASYPAVEFSGRFEMELKSLEDAEERQVFMEDMGITESAHVRLAAFAYRTLGYISFFTVGKDEVRAWSIRQGETAVDAAGTIHTDLARGFIRAEVFTYNDLMQYGSEKLVKQAGRFRLEGKQYLVADGDVLNIRFSV